MLTEASSSIPSLAGVNLRPFSYWPSRLFDEHPALHVAAPKFPNLILETCATSADPLFRHGLSVHPRAEHDAAAQHGAGDRQAVSFLRCGSQADKKVPFGTGRGPFQLQACP